MRFGTGEIYRFTRWQKTHVLFVSCQIIVKESRYTDPQYSRCLFGFYGPQINSILMVLDIKKNKLDEVIGTSLTPEQVHYTLVVDLIYYSQAFCQDYSSLEEHQLNNDTSELWNSFIPKVPNIQSLGRSIELFPLLPHRQYDGTTLLSLPGRMVGRPLYLLSTEGGSCEGLATEFRNVISTILGNSRTSSKLLNMMKYMYHFLIAKSQFYHSLHSLPNSPPIFPAIY